MIDIARVNLCAVLEQVFRNLNGAGEMQRRLAVTASRVHQLRLGCDQFAKFPNHPEPGRGMRGHDCAMFYCIGGKLGTGAI